MCPPTSPLREEGCALAQFMGLRSQVHSTAWSSAHCLRLPGKFHPSLRSLALGSEQEGGGWHRCLSGVHPIPSGPGFQRPPAHTSDLSCEVWWIQGHPSHKLESTYCYAKGFQGSQGHAPRTTTAHPSLFSLLGLSFTSHRTPNTALLFGHVFTFRLLD